MKPVDMIVTHNPDIGVYGDCFRCCIASLLEMKASEVPHFMKEGEESALLWYPRLLKFLKPLGLTYLEFQLNAERPSDWFQHIVPSGFDNYHILNGMSSRDAHSVVARNGVLAHDPHPSREGLIGPEARECETKGTYGFGFILWTGGIT